MVQYRALASWDIRRRVLQHQAQGRENEVPGPASTDYDHNRSSTRDAHTNPIATWHPHNASNTPEHPPDMSLQHKITAYLSYQAAGHLRNDMT